MRRVLMLVLSAVLVACDGNDPPPPATCNDWLECYEDRCAFEPELLEDGFTLGLRRPDDLRACADACFDELMPSEPGGLDGPLSRANLVTHFLVEDEIDALAWDLEVDDYSRAQSAVSALQDRRECREISR